MDKGEVLGILDTGSFELNAVRDNLDLLVEFLRLITTIDQLAGMDRRVSKERLSLYHAVSKEIEIAELHKILSRFFGDPVKKSGEPLPSSLADNRTVQYLGGIKADQTLFLTKIGQGELYGALFPWQRKINVVTVHLGFWNPAIPKDDYQKLEAILNEWISQAVSQQIEEQVTGKVQGISLPSFLQMSEMEGSTCSLRIYAGEQTGMLHLLNGNLIDAETGDLKHIDAAYAIISWDDPAIEILKAVGRKKNEIKMPLEPIVYLIGILSIIYVSISTYVGLTIASKYFKYKRRIFLLMGFTWVVICSPWWPSSISFLLALTTGKGLTEQQYILIGNVCVPIVLLLLITAYTEMKYQDKVRKVLLLFL